MSYVIRDYWIFTTLRIVNEWGGEGTGFLLANKSKNKIFLVTNKHVINEDERKRNIATKITLHVNIENKQKLIIGEDVDVQFERNQWKEHPNLDVDVMAFDITSLFRELKIKTKAIQYDFLATPEIVNKFDIKIADEITVIGFPSTYGLKHHITNFPFVREGIIASQIPGNLEDVFDDKKHNIKRKRILRGFLIDGAIIPGSSGSPVILKPTVSRYIKNEVRFDNFPPILLGIVSEMRYTHTEDFMSFADLGLAFNADTIRETIDLFE